MFIYVILEALIGIVAGLLLAIFTKKKSGLKYGVLDKIGIVTNILLMPIYACAAPFCMFIGMISEPYGEGLMWIAGGIIALICASSTMFSALGLGASVALRKKGMSGLSFAIQFAGVVGVILTFLLYAVFVGSLLTPLN